MIRIQPSRWGLEADLVTIGSGAGGLVKTVNVKVTVEQWNGPGEVLFSYLLESEPATGNGSYRAIAVTDGSSEIQLQVKVAGTGKLAPMWEAMSKPLLPKMAKSFSGRLKQQIESVATPQPH